MSPKSKTSAPAWCILNPQLFALTPEENQIINHHDSIWREHADSAKPSNAPAVEDEWAGVCRAAEGGCENALAEVAKFGSFEAFLRVRRVEQSGRNARFHREHCGLFAEVHGIAKRCREIVEKHLKKYRDAGEDVRRLIEVSPIVNDDATLKMEDLIADCAKVENHNPSTFEVLANHIELREVQP